MACSSPNVYFAVDRQASGLSLAVRERSVGSMSEAWIPPLDLASCASRDSASRGRLYEEPESATRGCFQRDRDRIIHAAAFRRLAYKTQVFVNHEGDFFSHAIDPFLGGGTDRTIRLPISTHERRPGRGACVGA